MTTVAEVITALSALAPHPVRDVRLTPSQHVAGRVDAAGIQNAAQVILGSGAELMLLVSEDRRSDRASFAVHYVFAHHQHGWVTHLAVEIPGDHPRVPSIAGLSYPASRFEREIRDLMGIDIEGHPDPRPLVRHGFWPRDFYPLRKDAVARSFEDDGTPFPFGIVEGEGVYEIPVGPVHAGIIEPGHFRFSAMGETILDMKQRLYFTHKGTEKLFEGRTIDAGIELAERISGDTSVGHAVAYARAIETGSGTVIPERASRLRAVALELERIYNHIADVGMILSDTGFALGHAHGYRLRERVLRINRRVSGHRLLRGTVAIGGITPAFHTRVSTVPDAAPTAWLPELDRVVHEFEHLVAICLDNSLVMDRLERTGTLGTDTARAHGVRGFVARGSGLDIDARRDHSFAPYDRGTVAVPVLTSGDVYARMMIRVAEVAESVRLVHGWLVDLPSGPERVDVKGLQPFEAGIALVEGWRGTIVHWVSVGPLGRLHRVKIGDPSFLNWPALSRSLVDNIVPDFPLCNKSFNQSYSGNDL